VLWPQEDWSKGSHMALLLDSPRVSLRFRVDLVAESW
jgi:hypothetical protein